MCYLNISSLLLLGAMVALCDVNEYRHCLKRFKVSWTTTMCVIPL